MEIIDQLHCYLQLEKHDRMMEYAKKFDVISPCQFGFRDKSMDAIAIVIGEIRSYLDGKIASCCFVFDLKKAFDTKNHSSLLSK